MRLFNQTIDIDPNRVEYNRIRLIFQREAIEAMESFQKQYADKVNNDNFTDIVPDIIYELLTIVIENKCIREIVNKKYYEMDTKGFIQTYGEQIESIWLNKYQQMADAIDAIDQRENQLDEYRVARRQNRGRWVGGGFGLGGAINGAFNAGMLNCASGIGHSIFNGFAKVVSSIKASGEKSRIIQDKQNIQCLAASVYNAVFALHLFLIDFLAEKHIDSAPRKGIVTDKNSSSAAALIANAKHIANQDELKKILIKSFMLNPYDTDWYLCVLEKCGDAYCELEPLESYFGLSGIKSIKGHKIEQFIDSLSIKNENEAIKSSQLLNEYKHKLGFNGRVEKERIITDAVKKFDREYRTVGGAIMHTREAADESRQEEPKIQEITSAIAYDDLESIKKGELELGKLHSELALLRKKRLHDKWERLDKSRRTVVIPDGPSLLYQTYQEATENKTVAKELQEEFIACEHNTSENNLDDAEKQFLSFKEKVKTGQYHPDIKKAFIDKTDNFLQIIDTKLRTKFGIEYQTREEAQKAEQSYYAIIAHSKNCRHFSQFNEISNLVTDSNLPNKIKKDLLQQLLDKKFAIGKKIQDIGGQVAGCGCLLIIAISIALGFLAGPGSGIIIFVLGVIVFAIIGSFCSTILSDNENQRFATGCISIVTLIAAIVASYYNEPKYLPWVIGFAVVFVVLSIIAKHRRNIKDQYTKRLQEAIGAMGGVDDDEEDSDDDNDDDNDDDDDEDYN